MKRITLLPLLLLASLAANAATLAGDCTIYASPSGGGNGRGRSTPTTLSGANTASSAGSVICIEGGTYNLDHTFLIRKSGTSGSHIKWEAYGDSNVYFVWTGTFAGSPHQMFNLTGTWPNGPSFLDFVGRNIWSWNGSSYANSGLTFIGGHHISVTGMYVYNTIGAALAAAATDYVDWSHNVSYHNGENPNGGIGTVNTQNGASGACPSNCVILVSGTAFNTGWPGTISIKNTTFTIGTVFSTTLMSVTTAPGTQTAVSYAFPSYAGFTSAFTILNANNCDTGAPTTCGVAAYAGIHNFIDDNIAAGEFDSSAHRTDGNGIILDTATNGTWPATLIMNNILYGNGGRCIETFAIGQANTLIFSNTCYLNGLDPQARSGSAFPEVGIGSNGVYIANNISYALGADGCRSLSCTCGHNYAYQNGTPTGLTWTDDMYYGGHGNGLTSAGFIHGNPLFINPPSLSSGDYGVSRTDPGIGGSLLGNELQLQARSPAKGAGVDPRRLTGLNANIISDLALVTSDINGVTRGPSWDLGAYQIPHGSTTVPHL